MTTLKLASDGPQIKSEDEFDPYCTNPNGKYLDCLISETRTRQLI